MRVDRQALERAQALALKRGGVLTAAQANSVGVSETTRRRLIDEGTWRRIRRGIFAVTPDSFMQRVWAGVIMGGPRSTIGAEAALCLWKLSTEPRQITVFVGEQTFLVDRLCWRFIQSERLQVGDPPRTPVAQAVIDVGEKWTIDHLVHLLGSAISLRLVTKLELLTELESRTYHRQRRLMVELIHEASDGVHSVLERHYRRGVEAAHGLPQPKRQAFPVGPYRVDNWYAPYKLIVEVDGKATHRGLASTLDMDRDNVHMMHGIATLRFAWSHVVHHPCQTAQTVAQALARGGWLGQPRRCPQCPQ
jgi:very-short-patch-repair endonuclease